MLARLRSCFQPLERGVFLKRSRYARATPDKLAYSEATRVTIVHGVCQNRNGSAGQESGGLDAAATPTHSHTPVSMTHADRSLSAALQE